MRGGIAGVEHGGTRRSTSSGVNVEENATAASLEKVRDEQIMYRRQLSLRRKEYLQRAKSMMAERTRQRALQQSPHKQPGRRQSGDQQGGQTTIDSGSLQSDEKRVEEILKRAISVREEAKAIAKSIYDERNAPKVVVERKARKKETARAMQAIIDAKKRMAIMSLNEESKSWIGDKTTLSFRINAALGKPVPMGKRLT